MARPLRTLLIDNHDSFTYTLRHLCEPLAELVVPLLQPYERLTPQVLRNDEMKWAELRPHLGTRSPSVQLIHPAEFDNIILSSGPGSATDEGDVCICNELLANATIPILGIGLGGRCILRCAGVASPTSTPSLNTVVEMQHSGVDPLWTGLPAHFNVVHYETPSLPDPLPALLDRIAWTSEGALALRNRSKPHWALFFQPGAHGSQQSNEVIRNFYTFTLGLRSGKPVQQLEWIFPAKPLVSQTPMPPSYQLNWTKIPCNSQYKDFTTEKFFRFVYHTSKRPDCEIFWLDSSHTQKGGARFSFIGDTTGPNAFSVYYDAASRTVTKREYKSNSERYFPLAAKQTFFDWMQEEMRSHIAEKAALLPFEFQCGFVGYFAHDMKRECGFPTRWPKRVCDAAFAFVDRLVAYDHETSDLYLLCLTGKGDPMKLATKWFEEVRKNLKQLSMIQAQSPRPSTAREEIEFLAQNSKQRHAVNLGALTSHITRGDALSLAVPNRIHTTTKPADALTYYVRMRAQQPSAYGAFMQLKGYCIVSLAHQRLISRSSTGVVECRPVALSVTRRATQQETDGIVAALKKDHRLESVGHSLVDAVASELAHVCQRDTVHITNFLNAEADPAEVHFVSSVTGQTSSSAIDCIRSVFPPAASCGVPKLRASVIADRLAGESRGLDGGTLGWLGSTGTCEFAVMDRTWLVDSTGSSLGLSYLAGAGVETEELWSELTRAIQKPVITLCGLSDPAYLSGHRTPRLLLEGRPTDPDLLSPGDDERLRHSMNVLDLSGSSATEMRLYESIYWEPGAGARLLPRHFARLRKSAAELGFTVPADLEDKFKREEATWAGGVALRVKVVLSKNGAVEVSFTPHSVPPLQKFRVLLSRVPIDTSSPLIRHKTSDRRLYQAALSLLKSTADDVVLFNERGQVTECTALHLAVKLVPDGPWITPALECGLLPGVMREEMLAKGEIQEGIITVDQLRSAVAIKVFNAVRGSLAATLVAAP